MFVSGIRELPGKIETRREFVVFLLHNSVEALPFPLELFEVEGCANLDLEPQKVEVMARLETIQSFWRTNWRMSQRKIRVEG
jgi:hypothetical protein